MIVPIVLVALGYLATAHGQVMQPPYYTLPPRPSLTGSLSPGYPRPVLPNVERLHANDPNVNGPTSFAFLGGNVYTVTMARTVVNIGPCKPRVIADLSQPRCVTPQDCGLLTSIRVGNNGKLLVVDAYRGLYQVDPVTGETILLLSSNTVIAGRRPIYLNDVVQAPDGRIYISDSSDKFDAYRDILIILEGGRNGRVIVFDPVTGAADEFLRDVAYPNGLELSFDGQYLLVAQSGRANILSVSLDTSVVPRVVIFSDNLPGCPTNIRRTSHQTYWVGLSLVRHSGQPSSMDQFSNNPQARLNTYYRDTLQRIRSYYLYYGLVIEVNVLGGIIGSLHDPTGRTFASVSEAAESGGVLYIGSGNNKFVGRLILPPVSGRVITNDSLQLVKRSRCVISEQEYLDYLRSRPSPGLETGSQGQTVPTDVASTGTTVPTDVASTGTTIPTDVASTGTTVPTDVASTGTTVSDFSGVSNGLSGPGTRDVNDTYTGVFGIETSGVDGTNTGAATGGSDVIVTREVQGAPTAPTNESATGGVDGAATGGTTGAATGGTTGAATGGTTGAATGGTTGAATGRTDGAATGGTTGAAIGGTTGAATGGTTGAATDGTSGAATGGTDGAATGGTTGAATDGTSGAATDGTTGAATGGTTGAATGGTTGAATGGTDGAATGGTTGAATGGTTGAATGGTTGAVTGGTTGAATGGTTGAATGGTTGAATSGTSGAATSGTSGEATGGTSGAASGGASGAASGGASGAASGGASS